MFLRTMRILIKKKYFNIGPSSTGGTIASASSLGVAAPSSATAVKKTSSGKETGDEPQHLKVCL